MRSFPLTFRASAPVVAASNGDRIVAALVDLDRQGTVLCAFGGDVELGQPVPLPIKYPTGACIVDDDVVVTGVSADQPVVTRADRGSEVGPTVKLPHTGEVLRPARPLVFGGRLRAVWETFSGHASTLWACALGEAEHGSAVSFPFAAFSAHLETAATDGVVTVGRVAGPTAEAAVLWLTPDLDNIGFASIATGASGIAIGAAGGSVCVAWVAAHASDVWARWFGADQEPVGEPILLAHAARGIRFSSLRMASGTAGRVALLHRGVSLDHPGEATEHLTVIGPGPSVLGPIQLDPASGGGRVAAWLGQRLLVMAGGELDPVRVYEAS